MSTWSTLTGFFVPGAVSTSCTCTVVAARVWLQVLGDASSCPWTTQKATQSPISPLQIESKDRNLLLPQMYFQEKSNMIGTPSRYEVSSGTSSKAARPSSEQEYMKPSANMHLPLSKPKRWLDRKPFPSLQIKQEELLCVKIWLHERIVDKVYKSRNLDLLWHINGPWCRVMAPPFQIVLKDIDILQSVT